MKTHKELAAAKPSRNGAGARGSDGRRVALVIYRRVRRGIYISSF